MISTPTRNQPGVSQPIAGGIIKLSVIPIADQPRENIVIGAQETNQTEWLIGRDEKKSHLWLRDPRVSRSHAKIKLIEGSFYFSDIGSQWGSVVNGKILPFNQLQLIQEGDTIYLGDTVLKINEVIPAGSVPRTETHQENSTVQPRWSNEDILVRCYRIIQETPDTKTFLFTGDPPLLFSYLPGQFATLEVEIDGQPVRRPYSISSSPSRPYTLAITVKRVPPPIHDPTQPPGLVSNWLNDHLKEGDKLKIIGGAMGNFTCLLDLPPKMLFIGAGSGITPIMSMLRWVYDTSTETDLVVIQSAKDVEQIIFREELDLMSKQISNDEASAQKLRVITTLTQPKRGQSWQGLTRRIDAELIQLVVPDLNERYIFCCGPDEFMDSIKHTVETLGFPMEQYKQESFGSKGKRRSKASTHESLVAETIAKDVENNLKAIEGDSNPPALRSKTLNNGNHQAAAQMHTGTERAATTTVIASKTEINFSRSQKTVEFDPDATLLDSAEEVGVTISSACRAGACGACKVRIQGEVHYDRKPDALSEEEEKKGYALACVAYPKASVIVEA